MKYIGMQENEVFLGNVLASDGIRPKLAGLNTLRLGAIAFDLDGNRLPDHRAMFIGRSEYDAYDRIRMAELSAIRGGRK
jgi:hypothetical protein